MLTKYNLKMPHAVYSGEDALENLKGIIAENKAKNWPCLQIRASRARDCWTFPWPKYGRPALRR